MAGSRARQPNKASLTMRRELEARGIDIVEMQMAVYEKAMNAYDNERGCQDGGETFGPTDTGFKYLAVANQAVATLARYAYPTMSAVKIENIDNDINDKVIDAVEVRNTILNDPFANRVAKKTEMNVDTGLPVLTIGEGNGSESNNSD